MLRFNYVVRMTFFSGVESEASFSPQDSSFSRIFAFSVSMIQHDLICWSSWRQWLSGLVNVVLKGLKAVSENLSLWAIVNEEEYIVDISDGLD